MKNRGQWYRYCRYAALFINIYRESACNYDNSLDINPDNLNISDVITVVGEIL